MIKIKQFFKHNWQTLLFCFAITIMFTSPYLVRDFLGMEHDTFFHISRIEGLASSFKDGIIVPRIYPYKNANFGYGNPMFYSDFFLVIPAILYNLGLNLASCYKLIVIVATFLSCWFMIKLVSNLTKSTFAPYLAGFLYIFSNYRITDVYVRGALGEVLGFVFLPICLIGIINVLYKDEKKWWILAIGFASLILCHNLTFALACFMFFVLILFYLKNLFTNKKRIFAILKAIGVVVLVTAFYTFPLIEQSTSDYFIFQGYANGDLNAYAVNTWEYFANKTVFGMGSNGYDYNGAMLISLGLFVMFAPLCYFLILDKDKKDPDNHFVFVAMIAGYIFMFACSRILPWSSVQKLLGFMQFPWRLQGIALTLLVIPASIYPLALSKKYARYIFAVSLVLLIFEGIWHISPALNRTFGITSQTTHEDIISGVIVDPYYSANYVRVDCAGGDYFPVYYTDFTTLSKCATDVMGTQDLTCDITKKGTTSTITIDSAYTGIANFPITWYKGYQVYYQEADGSLTKVETEKSPLTLVGFRCEKPGTYICKYDDTFVQTASLWLSIISVLGILGYGSFRKFKKVK